MNNFQCSAVYLNTNGQQEQVSISTNQGSLMVKSGEQQMVYLPAGSMDTILKFNNTESQIGTLELDNPEAQIKVVFQIDQTCLTQLETQLRGNQVFFRPQNYKIIEQKAQGIQLIQTQNRVSVEKVAMLPESNKDLNSIARLTQLKQEADILNFLKEHPHKNIIKLEEILTNGKQVSLVLENCEEGDLLQMLNRRNNKIDTKKVMKNLLEGIEHLHKLNLVHRDIKLQNILFQNSSDGNSLKIADFGLSCSLQQIPHYNPRCGTPGYTAPEVFTQQCQYDEKIDIYSAGIVLYNLLTLKNPFGNSKNVQDIIKRNASGDYEETHLTKVKENNLQAYDLLTKMLSKDRRQRPSASECLEHPYFSTTKRVKI